MKAIVYISLICTFGLLSGCTEEEPTDNLNSIPFFKISNPAMNTNVPDSTTIRISTNKENLVRVELYIDQEIPSPKAIFENPPFEYLWFTTGYDDGSQHLLQAKGYDSDGNAIDSKYVLVNVYRFRPNYLQAFLKADTLIELNWVDNCNHETGFEIEEAISDSNFFKIAEVDSNIVTYNFLGTFDLQHKLYFRVRAKSQEGLSGYSNIALATIYLNLPINLEFNFMSDTTATLNWTDNNDFETGYVIVKYLPSYGNIIVKELPPNSTETEVKDIFIVGNYYTYGVYAKWFNSLGETAYFPSKQLEFPPPYNLKVEGIDFKSVKLSWNDDNNYERGFVIERSDNGINFVERGRIGGHTFTDTNLDTAMNYIYRIAAFSRYNQSAYSNVKALWASQLKVINKFHVVSDISAATLSFDGSIIAFGGYTYNDVAIYLYDTFTGEFIHTFFSPDSTSQIFEHLAISPDNSLLAAEGDNAYVTVWDINSGSIIKRINNYSPPNVMMFSHDGKYLIIERAGSLKFFDVQTWESETRVVNYRFIEFMDINPDESIIATYDGNSNIKLWDYNSGSILEDIPSSASAYPLEFNKAGTRLYAAQSNHLFAWDVNTASVILDIPNFWRDRYIAVSEAQDIVVGNYYYHGLGAWQISTGDYIQEFNQGEELIEELFFVRDDKYLIGREFYKNWYVWEIIKKWISPVLN